MKKQSKLNTLSNTMQPLQQGIQQSFQQGQFVVNPVDGKEYQVQQQTPGKGIVLLDPKTQQQLMVSEEESKNLKPSLKTSFKIEDIVEQVLERTLNEPVKIEIPHNYTNKEVHSMRKNWMNIRKELKTFSQMNPQEIQTLPTYNEPRQSRAIRELKLSEKLALKYSPYKGDVIEGKGRDAKTGLPMREDIDIEVGLTEFPKDVDKLKNPEGYGAMTMEEMDRKFEEERPHFKNEQYLPDYTKKREESTTYLTREERNKKIKDLRKDFPEPRYSSVVEISLDSVLDQVIGITKRAEDEEIEKLPIQYKEVKKAPKLEEYVEPETLKEADPNVKTSIEMFKEIQEKITKIQEEIKKKTEPLQQAIIDATKELNEELAKNAALLKASLDMMYQELQKTHDKVAVYQDEIYAIVEREKATAPPATLAQILKKAQEINPKVAEEINKIKALIESENTKLVLERFIYKYPVSEVQKKKLSSNDENDILNFLEEAVKITENLKQLNKDLEESLV